MSCASLEAQLLEDADLLEQHLEAAAAEEVAALAADQAERTALRALRDERAGALDDVGVEAAAQPLVAGDDDDQRLAVRPRLADRQQRMDRRIDAGRDAGQHALHLRGVRPRVHDPLLRAAQLRRGDHLHRLGDLLRVLHRANAAPEVDQ